MQLKKYTASALLVALLVTNSSSWIAMAQSNPIIPDKGSLGPQLDETRNGTIVVNINAPNHQGLSHNQYQAFGVESNGAILNNANSPVATELAGYIMGNPNMSGVTASTILNEVTGTGKTSLNGAIEIAGHSANVIIANPNGIAVNNATLINAKNATLTTGNAIINNGQVTGYDVTKGTIAIEGQGLNTLKATRTDILAEAVKMNANVWAQDTQVVTGQNKISINREGTITDVEKIGSSNQIGLDVAAVGAMYANTMYLVGTNDGFGVNNRGLLSAQQKVTVDSSGRVINTGTIATGEADIKAKSLEQDSKAKIYADTAIIQVGTLEQRNESVVLTNNNLNIAGNELINLDKSLIKTEGQLGIGKSTDKNGKIIGKIDSIKNQDATIEAGQGAIINAKRIENLNGGISLKRVQQGDVERIDNEVTVANYPGQTFTLSDDKLYHTEDLKPDTNHVMLEDENIQFYIDGHGKDEWTRYKYTKTHEKDVVEKSAPARIIAGGDMEINADNVLNDASQISAAGQLSGSVSNYEVRNPESMEYVISKGEAISYSRQRHDGQDSTNIDTAEYNKVVEKSTKLPVSVYGSNVAIDSRTESIDASRMNSISRLATNPKTTYVIETDPNFTNRRIFLSSDYVLHKLNLDPMNVQKRLGDGYYEQQLVMQDIINQTGRSRLISGLTAEEQYKRLMDAGIRISKSQSIALGRSLTVEEQQKLSEDIVLLVQKAVVLPDGKTETVLVPTVYLAPTTKRVDGNANMQAQSINLAVNTLHNSSSIIADKDVIIHGDNLNNEKGLIQGHEITITSTGNITNLQGTIKGAKNTRVYANNDVINEGGRIIQTDADGQLMVSAGRDVINEGKQYIASDSSIVWDDRNQRREVISSVDQGEIIGNGTTTVAADRDVIMNAGTIQSNDIVSVSAKRNVELGGKSSSLYVKEDHFHSGKSGGGNKITTESHNEATIKNAIGSSIEGKSVEIIAGGTTKIAGSDVLAKEKVGISTNEVIFDTTQDTRTENHSLVEKKKSIAKRERTDKLEYIDQSIATGSTLSGKEVQITSTNDIGGQSVDIIGEKTVNIRAGGNVELDADKSVSDSNSIYRHKKSGLLGGAGIGFSIGKEKLNVDESNYEEQTVRNTIASTDGKVNIVADGKVHLTSADIVSQEGTLLDGAEVILDGNIDRSHSSYTESYKKSGLTVSLGGALSEGLTTGTRTIKQAGRREDKRLTALELNEARKQLQDGYNAVDKALNGAKIRDAKGNVEKVNGKSKRGQKNIDDAINLSVSIGSTSRKQSQVVDTGTYQGGTLISNGDVNVIARDANGKGITLIGERGQVKNISFNTANDVNLEAGKNTVDITNKYKQSGWSVGAAISFTTGSLIDVNASTNMARQNGEMHQEHYIPTTIKAVELAQIKAKRDSNIIGSTLSGKQVKAEIGNNLNIQSLQDIDNFKENSKSAGFNISSSPRFSDPTGGISASQGRIDSKWRSVTEQASIQAGEGGYDISVGNKTTLEGALITSKASKEQNRLTTKELELKAIHNEAEYSYQNNGVEYNYYGSKKRLNEMKENDKEQYDKIYNNIGLVPNLGVGSEDKANSTTQSAIADGMILVGGKQIDTKTINTDTEHTLNELSKIFDRKKIEERQELARLFAKNAFEEVHRLSDKFGWEEGSPEKIALHAAIGEIEAELSGNSRGSGALATGINELAIKNIIEKVGRDNPDQAQILSALLGGTVNSVIGKNSNTGAAVAASGTKHNLLHLFFKIPIEYLDLNKLEYNQVYVIESTVSRGVVGGTIGVVVDKYGRIYDTAGAEFSISDSTIPVSGTLRVVMYPNLVNSPDSRADLQRAVSGPSVGASVTYQYISWATGVAIPIDRQTLSQIDKTVSVGKGVSTSRNELSISGATTAYVGNLSDPEIWGSDYNRLVLDYFKEHQNDKLELYNNGEGKLILIKRDQFGVLQYSPYNKSFYRNANFDAYAQRMKFTRG